MSTLSVDVDHVDAEPPMKRQKKDMIEVHLAVGEVKDFVVQLLAGSKVVHLKRRYEEESGVPSHLQVVTAAVGREGDAGAGEVQDDTLLRDEMGLELTCDEDGQEEDLFRHYDRIGERNVSLLMFNGACVKSRVVRGAREGDDDVGGVDALDLMPARSGLKVSLDTMFSKDISHFYRGSISMAKGTTSYSTESTETTVCTKFTISFPSEEGGAIGQPAFVAFGVGVAQASPLCAKNTMFPAVLKSATECDGTFEFFVEMTPMRLSMGTDPGPVLTGMWEVCVKCHPIGHAHNDNGDYRWSTHRVCIPNMSFMMGVAGNVVITAEPYSNECYPY
jgi:hypothetical protein